jgi:ferrochelatase
MKYKNGVILLNMGGANNLNEVKLFLKNMFNDENIITVKSNILRKFISFLITTSRYKQSQNNYKLLGGKSPIVSHTKNLIAKLAKKKQDSLITFAMRYTPPFIDEALNEITKNGIKNLYLIPMYPQFSTTTTRSSLQSVQEYLKKHNLSFKIKSIDRFYNNSTFSQMIIDEILNSLNSKNPKDYNLIFSAHSLPQKIVDNGDTYKNECEDNVEILTQMLNKQNIYFKSISLAYQSKLGPVKWLQPSLVDRLNKFKNQNVIIYPLSFTIDNLETDFELSIEYKEKFENSIQNFIVCKCPNDKPEFIQTISQIIEKFENE